MSDIDFPHYGAVLRCGVAFDRTGIGATARSAGDGAFWTLMTPETFLDLATPLLKPRQSIEWLAARMDEGRAIAPAELSVRMVANGHPAVSRHEGRHRMTILRDYACGRPVPVRISVCGHRDHEITDSLIGAVRSGMRAQRGGRLVPGPLFEDAEADLGGLRRSGIPPPACRKSGMPFGCGASDLDRPSVVGAIAPSRLSLCECRSPRLSRCPSRPSTRRRRNRRLGLWLPATGCGRQDGDRCCWT